MDRDCLSCKVGPVRLLAEDWGRVLRACSSPPLPSADGAPWKEPESNWSPPQRQSSVSPLTKYRPQSFETEPGSMGCEKSGYRNAGL
jgi:hypothetical protein